MRTSYVNGTFCDHTKNSIAIEDRGYQFSDGVYEVIFYTGTHFIAWREHIERLANSLSGLSIAYTVDAEKLLETAKTLLKKNNLEKSQAIIYLQISRGIAKREHSFPTSASPCIVMTADHFVSKHIFPYQEGEKAITTADLRWKWRHLKTISLLPNVLAKQEAKEAGAVEAILIEDDDFITEGSTSNVFIMDAQNILRTHPTDNRILHGITRKLTLECAYHMGIEIEETMFTKQDLLNAQEIFITSSTKHLLPIIDVDGHSIGNGKPGSITQQLMNSYYHAYVHPR